ncbi:MAG: xylulokinase [Phycisphaerales bacterium]|nr:xylulokinase [Phycisphaerales bacterium]
MTLLLGIDVGTSAVKALVCDERGTIIAAASAPLELSTPRAGWSEQDPRQWWRATVAAVRAVVQSPGVHASSIRAVGLSGQMHGLVLMGADVRGPCPSALRPAILWNDQRCAPQCARIEELAGGRAALVRACGNAALAGFTAPKILWVREHEPETFHRASVLLLPKDYIRLCLTGAAAQDVSDASGTMLLDAATRRWNASFLSRLGLDPALLPPVLESAAPAGTLTPLASADLGLPPGALVAAGAGDNMAGAIGAGVVEAGQCLATIGTSGVIYTHSREPRADLPIAEGAPSGRTHLFLAGDGDAFRPGGFSITGCTLSAGGSLQWLHDALFPDVSYDQLLADAAAVSPGAEGLFFLPYLTGERAPHPDPNARGAFVGLSLRHRRGHLVRAVLEGVTFTMAQILAIQGSLGLNPPVVRLGGGGARSALWRQMQADVYGKPVTLTNTEDGPALGAAMLGGVAAGVWGSVPEACRAVVRETHRIEPAEPERYLAVQAVFDRLYHDLRPAFGDMSRL